MRWEQSRSHARRSLLRAVLTPIKFVHYDRPQMAAHVGCRVEAPAVKDEPARWAARVTVVRTVTEDL